MLSLVRDCGHWERQKCLDPDCDIVVPPWDDECAKCVDDEEWYQLWKDEMLDAELLRDRKLRPC